MENAFQILLRTSLLRLTNFMEDPEAMSTKIFPNSENILANPLIAKYAVMIYKK